MTVHYNAVVRAAERCTADSAAQIIHVCRVGYHAANGFRAEIHIESGRASAIITAFDRANGKAVVHGRASGRHIGGYLTHGEYIDGFGGRDAVCDFRIGFIRTDISAEARITQRPIGYYDPAVVCAAKIVQCSGSDEGVFHGNSARADLDFVQRVAVVGLRAGSMFLATGCGQTHALIL